MDKIKRTIRNIYNLLIYISIKYNIYEMIESALNFF